jgi:hypothetical protein
VRFVIRCNILLLRVTYYYSISCTKRCILLLLSAPCKTQAIVLDCDVRASVMLMQPMLCSSTADAQTDSTGAACAAVITAADPL